MRLVSPLRSFNYCLIFIYTVCLLIHFLIKFSSFFVCLDFSFINIFYFIHFVSSSLYFVSVSLFSCARFVEFYLNEITVWVTSSSLLRVICVCFSSSYLPRVYVVLLFFILWLATFIGSKRIAVFCQMTETHSSLRNVVCFNQNQTVDNVQ
jgi:hypothetical protein